MSIPTADDLARMRADAEALMPDLCDITDPGDITETDSGGSTISGGSTVTGTACRLSSAVAAAQRAFGEQLASVADAMLALPAGTAIRAGWTVTVNGDAYDVTSVVAAGMWGTAVRALLKRSSAIGG